MTYSYEGATLTRWVEEACKPHERHPRGRKYTQPCSFNHVHHRGVAAKAGSVHLVYSMERKGGARTHQQKHHPVLQGRPSCKNFDRPPTGSPQTMPLVQHSLDQTKRNTMTSMTLHHTPYYKDTTHFLWERSKSTSTQSTTLHILTALLNVPAIPLNSSSSITEWTGQSRRKSKVKDHTKWDMPTHTLGTSASSKLKPRPTWSLIDAHGQLGLHYPWLLLTTSCRQHFYMHVFFEPHFLLIANPNAGSGSLPKLVSLNN